jgi:hypothetical protein
MATKFYNNILGLEAASGGLFTKSPDLADSPRILYWMTLLFTVCNNNLVFHIRFYSNHQITCSLYRILSSISWVQTNYSQIMFIQIVSGLFNEALSNVYVFNPEKDTSTTSMKWMQTSDVLSTSPHFISKLFNVFWLDLVSVTFNIVRWI